MGRTIGARMTEACVTAIVVPRDNQRPLRRRSAISAHFVSEPATVYMTQQPENRGAGSSSVTLTFSRLRALAAAVLIGFAVSSCGYNNIPTLEEAAKAK